MSKTLVGIDFRKSRAEVRWGRACMIGMWGCTQEVRFRTESSDHWSTSESARFTCEDRIRQASLASEPGCSRFPFSLCYTQDGQQLLIDHQESQHYQAIKYFSERDIEVLAKSGLLMGVLCPCKCRPVHLYRGKEYGTNFPLDGISIHSGVQMVTWSLHFATRNGKLSTSGDNN